SGHRLALLVLELARIGLTRLGAPADDEDISPDALVVSLRASFRPDVAGDVDESYQVELDGEPYAVHVRRGSAEPARGTVPDPQLTLATRARTFAGLLAGATEAKAALSTGELQIDGPRRALDRFLAMFAYPAGREPTAV